ncbi:unnamed protein product [Clavelina lepadiformis]|uniref:Dolichyl-diphosphooligosaccharide--protein glycosyltransferase subunit 2 n=1 Tax=Clavelina lepadiformis TaxID=159417 RepID=A0ABP0H0P3_CLALP
MSMICRTLITGILVGVVFGQLTCATQLSSVISNDDGLRLIQYFKAPFSNLETAFYSLSGLKHYTQGGALGQAEKESACKLVKSCETKSLTSLYYGASVLGHLRSFCKHEFSKETVEFVKGKLNENASVKNIHAIVSILKNLGQEVDDDQVLSALLNALKSDNSILSSSIALLTVAKLSNPNLASILKSIDIEDMAAQADEVDERFLHFENNLEITSTFLSAVVEVSNVAKQPLAISKNQVILFTNFLLRSKTAASTVKEAYLLLSTLGRITSSTQFRLAKVAVVSGTSISEHKSAIQISVSNVFSQPLTKLSVIAESIIRASDNEVIVSNVPFKFDGQKTYNFMFWKKKPKSGFYDVTLAISSTGTQLFGVSDFEFRVKVTSTITVANLEIGTAEREQTGATLNSVSYPSKMEDMRADNQQKIIMQFQVKNIVDDSLVLPHQAFVRFFKEDSNQEIIFVAEPDDKSTYKFEVELASAGREQFNSVPGKYFLQLIVGDATISNPIFWEIGAVTLNLGEDAKKAKPSFEQQYLPKPEIHHVFRQPEERPPVVVSQAFTVACLLPIALLFILWIRVGANVSDLRLAPKNIMFHIGLAGIFILYYFCWLSLDMFVTIQYLCGIGVVTFIFGNLVLSDLANNR